MHDIDPELHDVARRTRTALQAERAKLMRSVCNRPLPGTAGRSRVALAFSAAALVAVLAATAIYMGVIRRTSEAPPSQLDIVAPDHVSREPASQVSVASREGQAFWPERLPAGVRIENVTQTGDAPNGWRLQFLLVDQNAARVDSFGIPSFYASVMPANGPTSNAEGAASRQYPVVSGDRSYTVEERDGSTTVNGVSTPSTSTAVSFAARGAVLQVSGIGLRTPADALVRIADAFVAVDANEIEGRLAALRDSWQKPVYTIVDPVPEGVRVRCSENRSTAQVGVQTSDPRQNLSMQAFHLRPGVPPVVRAGRPLEHKGRVYSVIGFEMATPGVGGEPGPPASLI